MATALSIGIKHSAAYVHGRDGRCEPDDSVVRQVQRNVRATWPLSRLGPLLQAHLRQRHLPLPSVTIGACCILSRDRTAPTNAGRAFEIVASGQWPAPCAAPLQLG